MNPAENQHLDPPIQHRCSFLGCLSSSVHKGETQSLLLTHHIKLWVAASCKHGLRNTSLRNGKPTEQVTRKKVFKPKTTFSGGGGIKVSKHQTYICQLAGEDPHWDPLFLLCANMLATST